MGDWISVDDRLPEVGQKVLVVSYGWEESGAVYVGELDPGWLKADPEGKSNFWGMPVGSSDWKLSGWSYFREPDVRWWMPCPDVPELAERR